jgi:hypothetical protein
MLGIRVRGGIELSALSDAGARAAQAQVAAQRAVISGDRVELTREGRLFATAVARELSV